jgi:hypothetical protein
MKSRLSALFVFPLLLAACSDSAGPTSGDRLTREEAMRLAAEVSSSVGTTSVTPVRNHAEGVASVPINFTEDHQNTHPCTDGGTVRLTWRITGSIDPEAGLFEMDVEGTHQPSGCAYEHDGLLLTINGDPDMDFDAHVAVANSQPSEPFTISINGGFAWSASDGRSGRCTVQYAEVTDFAAGRRTVDGNVCGHVVKETLTWSR